MSSESSDWWAGFKKLTQDVEFPVNAQGARALLSAVNDTLPFSKATSILDIACGQGAVFEELFRPNYALAPSANLLGIDTAESLLSTIHARQKNADPGAWARVRVEKEDAVKLSSKDSSHSHVLSQMGIFLVPDYQAALHEAHRVLTNDGIFAMTSVANAPWLQVLKGTVASKYPERHSVFPDVPSLWRDEIRYKEELEKCGFRDVVMHRVDLTMVFKSGVELTELMLAMSPFMKPIVAGLTAEQVTDLKQTTARAYEEQYPDHKIVGAALLSVARK